MNSRGLCVGMNLGSVSTCSPVQHSTTLSLYRHWSLLLLPPIPCNSTGSPNTTSESLFPASRNHYHATSFQKCLLPRLAPIWLPVSRPHSSHLSSFCFTLLSSLSERPCVCTFPIILVRSQQIHHTPGRLPGLGRN